MILFSLLLCVAKPTQFLWEKKHQRALRDNEVQGSLHAFKHRPNTHARAHSWGLSVSFNYGEENWEMYTIKLWNEICEVIVCH